MSIDNTAAAHLYGRRQLSHSGYARPSLHDNPSPPTNSELAGAQEAFSDFFSGNGLGGKFMSGLQDFLSSTGLFGGSGNVPTADHAQAENQIAAQNAETAAAAEPAAQGPRQTAIDSLKATGNDLLGRGNAGPEVRALQEMLEKAGYDLGPGGTDGIFGPKTQAAVEAFQRDQAAKEENPDNQLAVDGIVGAQTRAALGNDALARADEEIADKVDEVMDNHAERNGVGTETKSRDVNALEGPEAGKTEAQSAAEAASVSKSDDDSGSKNEASESNNDTGGSNNDASGGTMV